MSTDIDEFTNTLNGWLDRSDLLAETRRFLRSEGSKKSGGGLTDGQRANWRRRGLPTTFVEGAALCYCALGGNARSTAQRGAIEAGKFWQVTIVHAPDSADQEMLDVSILSYWEDLRALDRDADWFTPTVSRSTGNTDERPEEEHSQAKDDSSRNEGTDKWPESITPLVEDGSFRHLPCSDGAIVVSWDVGREPRGQGYAAHLHQAIANHRVEAVGGCPTISVTSATSLAYLPQSVLDRRVPGNPRGTPSAFSTFLNGHRALLMEGYLGVHRSPTEGDFRRIASWFKEGPQVQELAQSAHRVPQPIRQHKFFEEAQRWVREGKHQAFVTHVDEPLPFLSHMMVFGKRPLDEGVSDG